MNWSNKNVIKLIDAYKRKELLWDPKHKNYFNRLLKKDAWVGLEVELQIPLEQIKKKMEYLLSALRREKQKNIKSKTTGQGSDDVYRSTWFAYPHMQFLLDKNKPRDRIHSEDSTEDDEKEHILDSGTEESTEEGIRNQAQVNEITETPERQLYKSQVTRMQESRNPASAATKFKHPVPLKKAKKNASQNDPTLGKALQLMRSSAQVATAILASTASFPTAVAPDRYQIYANYLATKFRTYTANTFMIVEHQINNLLFSADRGEFDRQRGYQTDSTLAPTPNQNDFSQASTLAPTPNQNDSSQASTLAPTQNQNDFSQASTLAPTPNQNDSSQASTLAPTPNQNDSSQASTLAPTQNQNDSSQASTLAPTPNQNDSSQASTLASTPNQNDSSQASTPASTPNQNDSSQASTPASTPNQNDSSQASTPASTPNQNDSSQASTPASTPNQNDSSQASTPAPTPNQNDFSQASTLAPKPKSE